MPNTIAATLSALAIDYTWPLDEVHAATSFANAGAAGTYNLSGLGTDWEWPGQLPGMVRGAPSEYGMWMPALDTTSNPGMGGAGNSDFDAGGWTTGCLMAIVQFNDFFEETTVLNWLWGNSTTNYMRLTVGTDGVLNFTLRDTTATKVYEVEATSFVLEAGIPYLILVYQRADGTGIHIKVNDTDIALTIVAQSGTGIDNDSWVSEVQTSATTHTDFEWNNQNRVGNWQTAAGWIMQRPGIWKNSVPSNAQMTSLYQACNLDGTPQELIQYIASLATDGKPRVLTPMAVTQTTVDSKEMPTWGPCIDNGYSVSTDYTSGIYMRTNTFQASTLFAVEDTDVVSDDYRYNKFSPNSSDITPYVSTNSPSNFDGTETTGTVIILVDFNDGVTVGTTRTLWNLKGNNINTSHITVEIGAATGPIFTLACEVTDATDTYRITSVGDITVGDYFMLTITQDGSGGMKMYLDGSELDVAETHTTLPDTAWISDLTLDAVHGFPQQLSIAGGGGGGAPDLDANDIGLFAWLPNALTGSEVAAVWAAVNGTFPADTGTLPPPDGFADTIGDTTPADRDPADGAGPYHWWRLNDADGTLPVDSGIAPTSGTAITEGGDPDQNVQGPLILDPTNAAVFFDGVGDYYEVGVDGIAGQLVTVGIGTVGFFVSQKDLDNDNIAYSQSNDAATAYIKFGVNNGYLELYVQTSAGNSVTLTSSIQITDFDYVFGVFVNDGSNYSLYVQGVADTAATLTTEGTGAEGDWFDSATWTRSAIAARADSVFTTETTARFSEIFIFEETLSASQIAGLFDAATADGVAGATNANLRLVFEDVIFRNGGLADVRVENPRTDFNVALQVDRSQFLGGAEQGAGASVLVSGAVNGQVNGNSFDLLAAPTTGRIAVRGTTEDPTAAPSAFYSLLVSDNTLNQMGRADAPAIFLESGFGATIKGNRVLSSLGSAIGWRADARNVNALRNLIDTVSSGIAGIWVQNGLSTAVGRNWQIVGNSIIDVATGRGISIEGYNSALAERARHILVGRNKVINPATEAIYLGEVRDVRAAGNMINGGTIGIKLSTIQNVITLGGNRIEGHSDRAVVLDDGATNTATLVIDSNLVVGDLAAGGIYIDDISTLQLLQNELINTSGGIALGDITVAAKIANNKMRNVTTPLAFVGGTSQAGLDIGPNIWGDLGGALDLTVAAEAIAVLAGYHEITAGGATDLVNIGGEAREGRVVVLKVATGSAIITAKDGTGDMDLAGDFAMDPEDSLMLIGDSSGNWRELSRSANG